MPELFPKISIVTPTYNQGVYIEECIQSVLNQEYPNLEYIIIDGGSTDNTAEIVAKYKSRLTYYISEKDNGLYDAINKGFLQSTGEIMGWLNSDDILHRKSLFSIAEIFSSFEEVNWVQGFPTVIDEKGRILFHREPRNDKYNFLQKKYHDRSFIQQESTYWRRSLWQKAGGKMSSEYKYAGDFELWMRFFEIEHLYNTDAHIGAFRLRGKGQLSADHYGAYMSQCDAIVDKAIQQLTSQERVTLKERITIQNRSRALTILYRVLRISRPPYYSNINIYYDFIEGKFRLRPFLH